MQLDFVTSLLLCMTILPKSRMLASTHDWASNRSHVKIKSAYVDMRVCEVHNLSNYKGPQYSAFQSLKVYNYPNIIHTLILAGICGTEY